MAGWSVLVSDPWRLDLHWCTTRAVALHRYTTSGSFFSALVYNPWQLVVYFFAVSDSLLYTVVYTIPASVLFTRLLYNPWQLVVNFFTVSAACSPLVYNACQRAMYSFTIPSSLLIAGPTVLNRLSSRGLQSLAAYPDLHCCSVPGIWPCTVYKLSWPYGFPRVRCTAPAILHCFGLKCLVAFYVLVYSGRQLTLYWFTVWAPR
jgi:hypothetical protein